MGLHEAGFRTLVATDGPLRCAWVSPSILHWLVLLDVMLPASTGSPYAVSCALPVTCRLCCSPLEGRSPIGYWDWNSKAMTTS